MTAGFIQTFFLIILKQTIMKNLMPITNFKKVVLITADGELKIKYLSGYPRPYRFDASRGTFNENGETVLTKKGEPFTFAPIAYRKFRDDIMGFGAKNWIEFFFLNESLQVCALMFHGYSVDEFMRLANRMFYDDVSPWDCLITATPNEEVSNNPEAKGQKYFIAQFSYKPLSKEEAAKLEQATESLQIWRPPHPAASISADKVDRQLTATKEENELLLAAGGT